MGMTTTYTVELTKEHYDWFNLPGSPFAGRLTGQPTENDKYLIGFDETVAQDFRDLPEDHDGHMSDNSMWFCGLDYPVLTNASA